MAFESLKQSVSKNYICNIKRRHLLHVLHNLVFTVKTFLDKFAFLLRSYADFILLRLKLALSKNSILKVSSF